ncbi:MAG: hypothetical protein V1793_09570 [Pseudomonadota bacterium]
MSREINPDTGSTVPGELFSSSGTCYILESGFPPTWQTAPFLNKGDGNRARSLFCLAHAIIAQYCPMSLSVKTGTVGSQGSSLKMTGRKYL